MMMEWGSKNAALSWFPVTPEPAVVALVKATLVLFKVDTNQPDNLFPAAFRGVRIGISGVLAIPWAALPVVVSVSAVADTSKQKIVLPEILLVVATVNWSFSFLNVALVSKSH